MKSPFIFVLLLFFLKEKQNKKEKQKKRTHFSLERSVFEIVYLLEYRIK